MGNFSLTYEDSTQKKLLKVPHHDFFFRNLIEFMFLTSMWYHQTKNVRIYVGRSVLTWPRVNCPITASLWSFEKTAIDSSAHHSVDYISVKCRVDWGHLRLVHAVVIFLVVKSTAEFNHAFNGNQLLSSVKHEDVLFQNQ